jgi:hypothetical protein
MTRPRRARRWSDIDVLNEDMEAAGARFFAGGLQSAPHASSEHISLDGVTVALAAA